MAMVKVPSGLDCCEDSFSGLKMPEFLMCVHVVLGYVPVNDTRETERGERDFVDLERDPLLEHHLS